MRTLAVLISLALLALSGLPCRAQPGPALRPGVAPDVGPSPGAKANPTPPAKPDGSRSSLDDLFARLAAAQDEEEAGGVARIIERRLERSGSDTADLLMQRAGTALEGQDAALAVELLDRVTQLRPAWAEAWSRRAAAFYQLDDPGRAIVDLEEALTREPRHYTAWTALGHMEMATGEKRLALAAYRHALKIHPFLKDVKAMVDRLAPEIDGRDL